MYYFDPDWIMDESPDEAPFGTNNSFGFGSANQNPFGTASQMFAGNTTFGSPAPAFGQTAAPMFGQPANSSSSLFGAAPQSTFGQPSQSTFGTSSIFGQQNAPQQQQPSLFGTGTSFGQQQNKPNNFSFSSPQTSGLFGQANQQQPQPQPAGNIFQPSTSSNIFGAPAFGAAPAQAGTVIKFTPVTGTDTMQKGGNSQMINTKHHSITCMKDYENKSFEELRFEDYAASRKGPQQQPAFASTAQPFGSVAPSAPLFGQTDNKPAFGAANGFGQTPSFGLGSQPSSTQTVFGKSTTAFGTPMTSANTFGFTSTASNNVFGSNTAQKPFGSQSTPSLFGNTPTQQPTGFGSSSFFGQTSGAQPNFFTKPAQPTFPANPTGTFSFGQTPATKSSNLFNNTPTPSAFNLFGGQGSTASMGSFGTQGSATSFGSFGAFNTKPTQNTFGTPNPSVQFGASLPSNNLFGGLGTKPSFGTGSLGQGLFANNLQQSNTSFNSQPQQITQPSTQQLQNTNGVEVRNFLNVSDPYGYTPHLKALPDNKSETHYVTNPKELEKVLKSHDTPSLSPERIKVKFGPSATNNKWYLFDTSYNNGGSDGEQPVTSRRSSRKLTIKNVKAAEPIIVYKDGKRIEAPPPNITKLPRPFRAAKVSQTTEHEKEIFKPSNEEALKAAKEDLSGTYTPGKITYKETDTNTPEEIPSPVVASTPYETTPPETPPSETLVKADSTDIGTQIASIVQDAQAEYNSIAVNLDARSPPEPNELGIVNTRTEYYTIPSIPELNEYINSDGQCLIKGFTIGRVGYGNVYFPDVMDVAGINIDELVHFRLREISVYPDEEVKPPKGEGLNRPAQVTLDLVFPKKSQDGEGDDSESLSELRFTEVLKAACEKAGTDFIDYRPETGSWVFNVKHFSKYGLDDKLEQDSKKEVESKQLEPQKELELPMDVDRDDILESDKQSQDLEQDFEYTQTIEDDQDSFKFRGLGGMHLFQEYTITSVMDPIVEINIAKPIHLKQKSRKLNLNDMDSYTPARKPRSAFINFGSMEEIRDEDSVQDLMDLRLNMDQLMGNFNRAPFVLKNLSGRVPLEKSLVPNNVVMDMSAFKGRSFKPSWGKGLNFITLVEPAPQVQVYSDILNPGTVYVFDLELSPVYEGKATLDDPFMDDLDQMMELFLQETTFEDQMDRVKRVPHCSINQNGKLLEYWNVFWKNYNNKEQLTRPIRQNLQYYTDIFSLLYVFWGEIEEIDSPEVTRKELFNEWLIQVTNQYVVNEMSSCVMTNSLDIIYKKIFVYLSGNQVNAAVNLAYESNMPNLALQLSQLNSTLTKSSMQYQLDQWNRLGSADFIDRDLIKLYMLCAGIPFLGDVHICEYMGWIRSLALHFWYVAKPSDPIEYTLNLYKQACEEYAYADKPYPLHGGTMNTWDLLYFMMKLYSNPHQVLDAMLSPPTHTDNPVDYRLSWMLMQIFISLKIGHISESAQNHITTSYAMQLEQIGLYKWAVYVLLFIRDVHYRKTLVMGVLNRNILLEDENLQTERSLVKDLHIPVAWIHEIKSHRAQSVGDVWARSRHLEYAKDYQTAFTIYMETMVPIYLCNSEYDLLDKSIRHYNRHKGDIEMWRTIGNVFFQFANIMQTVRSKNDFSRTELREIFTEMRHFIKQTEAFPGTTVQETYIISEISKYFTKHFRTIVWNLSSHEVLSGRVLCNLMQQLVMPMDYKYEEILKVVSTIMYNEKAGILTFPEHGLEVIYE